MDLTEAEDIKKRWQEYTEELYKKRSHDPDNQYAMTSAFSWQNSISLFPASFHGPRPNLPVPPGVS